MGWIGVDLDGTLAVFRGWQDLNKIGPPIPAMVERVKQWLTEGKVVKIFTARVAVNGDLSPGSTRLVSDIEFAARQRCLVQDWCEEHIGHRLEVTATKDFGMIELWDDRCIQIIRNVGEPVLSMERQEIKPS